MCWWTFIFNDFDLFYLIIMETESTCNCKKYCKYTVCSLKEVAFANLLIETKIEIKESSRPT